jgi:hypothetical protein
MIDSYKRQGGLKGGIIVVHTYWQKGEGTGLEFHSNGIKL